MGMPSLSTLIKQQNYLKSNWTESLLKPSLSQIFHFRLNIIADNDVTLHPGAEKYFNLLYDPKFEGCNYYTTNTLCFLSNVSRGQILDRVIDERFQLQMSGMIFPFNNRFFNIFGRRSQQMFEAGMIERYTSPYFDLLKKKKRKFSPQTGPQVLTMQHLEAGFLIWLASVCFSKIVFAFEWLISFKNYIIVESLLDAFYTQKRLECYNDERSNVFSTTQISENHLKLSEIESEIDSLLEACLKNIDADENAAMKDSSEKLNKHF